MLITELFSTPECPVRGHHEKKLAPAITNYLFSKELAPMSNGGTSANYLVFYSNGGTSASDFG